MANSADVIGVPTHFADHDIEAMVNALRGRTVAILTGAGVSTDSGIPDYRGADSKPQKPMTFQQFLSGPDHRKRYWAGSHLGWRRFDAAQPNGGHQAITRLEARGLVTGTITQNVDGLHQRAGSLRVIDLHGTLDRVLCLACSQTFSRADIAERLTSQNPWLDELDARDLGPDGDVAVEALDSFVTPECSVCGGILKPDIVFFGEFVPVEKFAEARALLQSADALLIAGSSLVVNSGIRLLDQAAKRRVPIVIINRGATRGDQRATVKVEGGASELLTILAERLTA
ncbi:MAG: NAD-dependent protein deacetylase [Microbacteriaceae bacterium]|nr:NAD-dependent protein deacetylase [Microbacteriaceae bacterium]